MGLVDGETLAVWRRTVALGWPITVDQTFTTLMRTVDIVVTGLFSPVAVAAVGLADLYGRIPLRVGLGLGAGTIALASQDTGRGAARTRDEAISQALLVGLGCGLPFVLVGLLLNRELIAVLGADAGVVRAGGRYLAFILAAAPMRIVLVVASRSLQGTGDTMTPMYVNASSNVLNIVLTVSLGLGVWMAPRLGIVGVGLATAVSETAAALAIVALLASTRTAPGLARPRSRTITRQLVAVSLPNFAEGMSTSLANFPFNALVLLFGTPATAAYHIGRRLFLQLTGPLYRSIYTVASIVVGQTLGEGRLDAARRDAVAMLTLSVGLLSLVGVAVFLAAPWLVRVFTRDPLTAGHAVAFTRAFAVSMVFVGLYYPLAGTLAGAGDTRTPFYARLTGVFVFLLGGSYLLGVTVGLGLPGVYAGIVLSFVSWVVVVAAGFRWGGWQGLAERLIAERAADESRHGGT